MTPEEKVALLKKAGVWDVIGFPSCIDKLFDLVAAHEREKQAEQEPVAYEVGGWYKQQDGEWVQFVEVENAGKGYETMCCKEGIHRYTKRDFGRVTGSSHDYSDPRNTPPLYAAPVRTKDLTDDEIHKCMGGNFYNALDYARAVIAADREKNK